MNTDHFILRRLLAAISRLEKAKANFHRDIDSGRERKSEADLLRAEREHKAAITTASNYLTDEKTETAEAFRAYLDGETEFDVEVLRLLRMEEPDAVYRRGTKRMSELPIAEIQTEGPLAGWPKWAAELPERAMTQRECNALPEYSSTLPDSYKRPLSEGGRPWKRDLNFFGRFGEGKKFVYCEYVPDLDPKFLAIKNERIVVTQSKDSTGASSG